MARIDPYRATFAKDLRPDEDTHQQLLAILEAHPDWYLLTYHQSHHDVHGNFEQEETHIVAHFVKERFAIPLDRGDDLRWALLSETTVRNFGDQIEEVIVDD